jgi:hypothetical protein
MHRPTRKHHNLQEKLARKKAESRLSGQKARRWKRAVDKYAPLCQEHQQQ